MANITQLNPYAAVYPAGNNMWHAVESIRKFGQATHAAAYVELLLERGEAKTVADALQQAGAEMANVDRLLRDVRLHKLAHQRLQQQNRQATHGRRKLGIPTAALPTFGRPAD